MSVPDFIFNYKKDEDDKDYEIILELLPNSEKAKSDFGDCIIATINLSKDTETLRMLNKTNDKINENNTIILEMIQRHSDCDKKKQIAHIAGKMLCKVLNLLEIDVEYIYLYAIHKKLIKTYEELGFVSELTNPFIMIGDVKEINTRCLNSPKLFLIS